MSERFYTTVSIGGTIKAADLTEFQMLVGNFSDTYAPTSPEDELAPGDDCPEGFKVVNAEARATGADDLLEFCMAHDLSCTFDQDGNGVYDREFRYWAPGMDKPRRAALTNDGSAFCTLYALKEALAAGQTLEQVISELEADSGEGFELPPLLILAEIIREGQA